MEPLKPGSVEELRPLLSGYRFIHDGHFPDLPQDTLIDQVITDVRKNEEYAALSGWWVQGAKRRGVILGKSLRWDTQHFGHSSARLLYTLAEGNDLRIKDDLMAWFLNQGRLLGSTHIAARCNMLDPAYLEILQRHGFSVKAVNVMLQHRSEHLSSLRRPDGLSWADFRPDMASELLQAMHTDEFASRFTSDTRFDQNLVDAMYQSWVSGLFHSFPEYVVVAKWHGRLAGFAAAAPSLPAYGVMTLPDGKPALVNMVAVNPQYRGKAIGALMIGELVKRLRQTGITSVYAQASLGNPASFSTFLNADFRPVSTVADLHWWNE